MLTYEFLGKEVLSETWSEGRMNVRWHGQNIYNPRSPLGMLGFDFRQEIIKSYISVLIVFVSEVLISDHFCEASISARASHFFFLEARELGDARAQEMERDWSAAPVSPSGDGWFGHYGRWDVEGFGCGGLRINGRKDVSKKRRGLKTICEKRRCEKMLDIRQPVHVRSHVKVCEFMRLTLTGTVLDVIIYNIDSTIANLPGVRGLLTCEVNLKLDPP